MQTASLEPVQSSGIVAVEGPRHKKGDCGAWMKILPCCCPPGVERTQGADRGAGSAPGGYK